MFSNSVFNISSDLINIIISSDNFLFFSNFVDDFFAEFFKSVHISIGDGVVKSDHFDGLLS